MGVITPIQMQNKKKRQNVISVPNVPYLYVYMSILKYFIIAYVKSSLTILQNT